MSDKREIHRMLLARLEEGLRTAEAAQQAAQAGATHPEARQEDPKDTRAIEGQYLARGLAERVESMREAVARCRRLELVAFGADDPIEVTALVTLEDEDGAEQLYFIVPWGGGETLGSVKVLTPNSPLGRAIVGRRIDDEIDLELPGRRLIATITSIA